MTDTLLPREETAGARRALRAIAETIQETGAQGCPSGVLYAGLMEFGMSFETYCKVISGFKSLGYVREEADVLYWIA